MLHELTEFDSVMIHLAKKRVMIELQDGRIGNLTYWSPSHIKVHMGGRHLRFKASEFKRVLGGTA